MLNNLTQIPLNRQNYHKNGLLFDKITEIKRIDKF